MLGNNINHFSNYSSVSLFGGDIPFPSYAENQEGDTSELKRNIEHSEDKSVKKRKIVPIQRPTVKKEHNGSVLSSSFYIPDRRSTMTNPCLGFLKEKNEERAPCITLQEKIHDELLESTLLGNGDDRILWRFEQPREEKPLSLKKVSPVIRRIQKSEDKILDFPGVVDDIYYKHVTSTSEGVALLLQDTVYFYSENKPLWNYTPEKNALLTSIQRFSGSSHMACSLANGRVAVIDVKSQSESSSIQASDEADVLASESSTSFLAGLKDGLFGRLDFRQQNFMPLARHEDRVTGLAHKGHAIAVGDNTGTLKIWDMRKLSEELSSISAHSPAGVMDVVWCPWDSSRLLTAGGLDNHMMNVYDISNIVAPQLISQRDTGSQVTSLIASPAQFEEVISCHGYSNSEVKAGQINVWKWYKDNFYRIASLNGHDEQSQKRSLSACLYGNERHLVSVGSDEQVKIWKDIFPPGAQKKNKVESCLEVTLR